MGDSEEEEVVVAAVDLEVVVVVGGVVVIEVASVAEGVAVAGEVVEEAAEGVSAMTFDLLCIVP